jgi:hypothetical protein
MFHSEVPTTSVDKISKVQEKKEKKKDKISFRIDGDCKEIRIRELE